MTLFLYRLGRACVRHRRRVLLAWIVLPIAAMVLGQAAGGEQKDSFSVPGTEAQSALDVLRERFPAAAGTTAQVVFATDEGTLTDAAPAAAVRAALEDVAAQPGVASVGELRTAPSGAIGFVEVRYAGEAADIKGSAYPLLEATAAEARSTGLHVELGGDLPTEAENAAPGGQEIVGLVAAVIVLLLAFGSVIAMGLPIVTALLGLGTSVGLITLALGRHRHQRASRTVLATMIGLGRGHRLRAVHRHPPPREPARGHDGGGVGRPGHRHRRARPCCSPASRWSSPSPAWPSPASPW